MFFEDDCAVMIGGMAIQALLEEVRTTPKPGLVDLNGPGIHLDMTFDHFEASAHALGPYFESCALKGLQWRRLATFDDKDALPDLRPLGVKAEKTMFEATGGVNTHKGLVFSMGLIAAGTGWSFHHLEKTQATNAICEKVSQWMKPHMDAQLIELKNSSTYGARQFAKEGALGARGQALAGYPLVRSIALPLLRQARAHGKLTEHECRIVALLGLIGALDDSNVLGKHGQEALKMSQDKSNQVLQNGHFTCEKGRRAYEDYCNWSLENRISHGGSADMLALTLFFEGLENFRKKVCIKI